MVDEHDDYIIYSKHFTMLCIISCCLLRKNVPPLTSSCPSFFSHLHLQLQSQNSKTFLSEIVLFLPFTFPFSQTNSQLLSVGLNLLFLLWLPCHPFSSGLPELSNTVLLLQIDVNKVNKMYPCDTTATTTTTVGPTTTEGKMGILPSH